MTERTVSQVNKLVHQARRDFAKTLKTDKQLQTILNDTKRLISDRRDGVIENADAATLQAAFDEATVAAVDAAFALLVATICAELGTVLIVSPVNPSGRSSSSSGLGTKTSAGGTKVLV